jgi:hypothetical protein
MRLVVSGAGGRHLGTMQTAWESGWYECLGPELGLKPVQVLKILTPACVYACLAPSAQGVAVATAAALLHRQPPQ